MKAIKFFLCLTLVTHSLFAQEAEKPELIVRLGYYTLNNSLQNLKLQTQVKADNKLQPVKNVSVHLYLDSVSETNLIGKVKTDEKGFVETTVPVTLKNQWAANPNHTFIAVTEATPSQEETVTELEITKAKIVMDTLNEDGARSVTAQVFAFENGEWIAAGDVEVKIGVKRLGGNLKVSDDESFTTDSLGQVTAEFSLDSLPADDRKNNITLVARVEDNELFGNLSIEKTVPWGKYYEHETNFGQRSLAGKQFKSPLWLIAISYSIFLCVWGVIIYLLFQILKIKKLGKEEKPASKEPAEAASELAI